jgi:hypothetical protein
MQHQPVATVAVVLLSASFACARGPSESSVAIPRRSELGEVVKEMSDSLCIVFQDRNKVHWFGSDGQGVFRFDGKTLVRYTTADGLADDHIRQIEEDGKGNLFVMSWGGVDKFDGQRFTKLNPIDSRAPASRWKLEAGDLWFTDGPFRYDGKHLYRLEFPKIPLEDEFNVKFPDVRYSPYAVYTIHRDRKGAIWFGTGTFGVCRFDGKRFDWITEDELTELDIGPSFGVRGIVEDKEGKLWLSNLLHRYDASPDVNAVNSGSSASTNWYAREPGLVNTDKKGDPGNAYFMSGLTDRHGVSWVATYGAGVWRIDGKALTHVPVVVGTRPITIFSIYEDKDGVLWLGTQTNGVWRFNGKAFERFKP